MARCSRSDGFAELCLTQCRGRYLSRVLSKDPKEIADDLIAMTCAESDKDANHGENGKRMSDAEDLMKVNFRNDIAANLGGDFLLSLDGPVLPTPSWKAVVEVHDAQKMEQTLESVTDFIRTMVAQDKDQDKDKSLKGLQDRIQRSRFAALLCHSQLGHADHHCAVHLCGRLHDRGSDPCSSDRRTAHACNRKLTRALGFIQGTAAEGRPR